MNFWIVVGLLVFLATAGSGLFVFANFSPLGVNDPTLESIMLVMWAMLAATGWAFTVSTAKSPMGMGVASVLLAVSFVVLALGLEGSRIVG